MQAFPTYLASVYSTAIQLIGWDCKTFSGFPRGNTAEGVIGEQFSHSSLPSSAMSFNTRNTVRCNGRSIRFVSFFAFLLIRNVRPRRYTVGVTVGPLCEEGEVHSRLLLPVQSKTSRSEDRVRGKLCTTGVPSRQLRHQGRKAADGYRPCHGRDDRKRERSISGLRWVVELRREQPRARPATFLL